MVQQLLEMRCIIAGVIVVRQDVDATDVIGPTQS